MLDGSALKTVNGPTGTAGTTVTYVVAEAVKPLEVLFAVAVYVVLSVMGTETLSEAPPVNDTPPPEIDTVPLSPEAKVAIHDSVVEAVELIISFTGFGEAEKLVMTGGGGGGVTASDGRKLVSESDRLFWVFNCTTSLEDDNCFPVTVRGDRDNLME